MHAEDAPHYAVEFDAAAKRVDVRLCLTQAHERVLFAADSRSAMAFVHDVKRSSGAEISTSHRGWVADQWQAGECVTYSADLAAIAATRDPDQGWSMGEDLVSAPQLWLLRPDVQATLDAQASVTLPAGWNISAPWQRLSSKGLSTDFQIPNTPPDWSASVAFGKFDEELIVLPGGKLHVAILHGATDAQRTTLHTWLGNISKAILSAYGRLPLNDVQVLVIPVTAHGRAVVFGQSTRGQGNALQLLVDPAGPADDFADDWTAVHELSHLMHPYLGDRGRWLAEGLATYYQNILRARSGMLTAAQGWDRLAEGFRRGEQAPHDETLEEAAMDMHHQHAYQRVYWAGAVYWLTVDRDLRRNSGGALNLETALSRFRDCCLPDHTGWQPENFVARLDALLKVDTFSKRYGEFAQMKTFPDWHTLYADLGIGDDGRHLSFDSHARDAAERDAIIAARPAQIPLRVSACASRLRQPDPNQPERPGHPPIAVPFCPD